MRAFVAIDLDDETKDKLWGLVQELRAYKSDVRWVKRDSLHLTLKFLGDVPEGRLPSIEEALYGAASFTGPFEIEIKGTGAFPSYSRPRVLWVGIKETDRLFGLQQEVEDKLLELGFEKEKRPFHPHITLGRVRSQRGLQEVLREIRRYKALEFGKIYVTEFVLMESILQPDGARYRKVFTIKL